MNINEILKALRGTCDQCNPTPCCEFEVLGDEAAKLIETLQLRLVESQSREQEAVKLIAKLVLLCDTPYKEREKIFRRLNIGAGDYMGSGYAFVDAFNHIWDDFSQTANDGLYRAIRNEIELRNIQEERGGVYETGYVRTVKKNMEEIKEGEKE